MPPSKFLFIAAIVFLVSSLMLPAAMDGMPGFFCFLWGTIFAFPVPNHHNPEHMYERICACRASFIANCCAVLLLSLDKGLLVFFGSRKWSHRRNGLFVLGAIHSICLIEVIRLAGAGVLRDVYIGFSFWLFGLMLSLAAAARYILAEMDRSDNPVIEEDAIE